MNVICNNTILIKLILQWRHFLMRHRSKSNVPVHAMKVIGGIEVYLHSSLTSALDGGEWLTPCPGCFSPGKFGNHASEVHMIFFLVL